jgi:hypothetical protein
LALKGSSLLAGITPRYRLRRRKPLGIQSPRNPIRSNFGFRVQNTIFVWPEAEWQAELALAAGVTGAVRDALATKESAWRDGCASEAERSGACARPPFCVTLYPTIKELQEAGAAI